MSLAGIRSIGSIEALVPRSLVELGGRIFNATTNFEGLCPVHIRWQEGLISGIEEIKNDPCSKLNILLPRLLEPHAHIDKAFSWSLNPNLLGTYENALKLNLLENQKRDFKEVKDRVNRSLILAYRNGLRGIRSHIDSFDDNAYELWEILFDLQKEWKPFIDLQLVALVPLEYWITKEGHELAKKIASRGGLLGGVLCPPFDDLNIEDTLFKILSFAEEYSCGIDLHIDESDICPAEGLMHLLNVLDQIHLTIPITCSHACSMSLLPQRKLRKLADRLAYHKVNVIALPLTNSWLLGRKRRSTPLLRPIAPIVQLQEAGVVVAIGGDNVQDPWFPGGNFDPLSLMAFSLSIAHLSPWERLGLAPFTTASSELMRLSWDGILKPGNPADFIELQAPSWADILAVPPKRKVIVSGKSINERDLSFTSRD